jgi:hypothetical protein
VAAVTVAFARLRERGGRAGTSGASLWLAGGSTWCARREHDGRSLHGHTPDEPSEYIEAEAAS